MRRKIKVAIFGTSSGAKKIFESIDLDKVTCIKYLDNDKKKQGSNINGIEVISPSKIEIIEYDYILLGSESYSLEMKEQLLSNGVKENKIIDFFSQMRMPIRNLIKDTYEIYLRDKSIFKNDVLYMIHKDYGISTLNTNATRRKVFLYDYPDYLLQGMDYVRLSTTELLSREINEQKIKGEIAELGVYKGDFSKLLSDLFPNRKLYLFDTFEGFSEEDVKFEKKKDFSNAKTGHLGDTNIEIVIDKIANKENIIVKKGYFPQTTEGLDNEEYAFVSIDVDLYKPTFEGLCYFYEHLSKGGYILIHDYNLDYYKGVKKAVHDFSSKYGVSFVPVSDYHGSVIITK